MCWIYRYWKAWNNSLDFYLICLHSYLLISLKLLFLSIGIWSPNYHSFWSNSSLWLHKYSIADEKVYLQRWMLNHSTIKSITILSPLTVDKIVQKKLQIRDCRDGDNTKMGEFGYFYQSKHWWCSAGTHLFCYNVKLKVAENLSSMRL